MVGASQIFVKVDYELNALATSILGPIHPHQVMGMDPVNSHDGTQITQSISINPTYQYPSHDLKCHCHTDMCPLSITINLGLESDPGGYWWDDLSPH